jgi:FMN reductase (NADPH)/FMN reductase [NAD(P)H]
MNSTLEVIANRRSVRKYDPTPLTTEEKDAILNAAMRAPTAGNMMLYSIIEVEDQALKERLAVSCDNQPFIAAAPYVLLFAADYQRWIDLFTFSGAEAKSKAEGLVPRLPEEGDLLLACCDALIAAQNSVIAAESMGIGSCYIGDILENCETHQQMFNLPRFTLPVALLCFGRPARTNEEVRLTRRFDRKFIVSRNTYRRVLDSEFPEMLRATTERQFPDLSAEEGAKAFAQRMYTKKFISDFSVEMSRSVRQWLAIWSGQEK